MLYILVVCAGHLCMPVESVGAYTLTQAECGARMMQPRGTDVHCYSNADTEYWPYEMRMRDPEPGRAIAYPH